MKLGIHIMAQEPVSEAYFINPSHQSVCLHVYPSYRCKAKARLCATYHSVIDNSSVNTFLRQWIPATIEELLDACVCGSVCIPISLLGNSFVMMFPRRRRIVGGVVFYAVRVVSKESRRLVHPRSFVGDESEIWILFLIILTLEVSVRGDDA
jgi:hypothetical protein